MRSQLQFNYFCSRLYTTSYDQTIIITLANVFTSLSLYHSNSWSASLSDIEITLRLQIILSSNVAERSPHPDFCIAVRRHGEIHPRLRTVSRQINACAQHVTVQARRRINSAAVRKEERERERKKGK